MSGRELLALAPLWIPAATAVLVMLAVAVKRNYAAAAGLAGLGLAAAFASTFWAARFAPVAAGPLLAVDAFTLVYTALAAAGGFIVVLLGYGYFKRASEGREEFFILVVLTVLGAGVLAASRHFASLFLGLEILSISLYALIAYEFEKKEAVEAGIKYLILASAAAAVLVFGAALVYAATGTMDFAVSAAAGLSEAGGSAPLLLLGLSLVVAGVGFKLALVPFHMWAPDVYQGAPAPVAGLISTVSKGGMFAALVRLFTVAPAARFPALLAALGLLSGASMIIGNLLALRQNRVKRILAYSSIAHFGYLLVAFLAGGAAGIEAGTYYLTAYFIMMLAAFGVITVLSREDADADALEDFRGLFWRRPVLASVLTGALFSLAGIPLTAGFIGKFYVAAAGVGAALWALVILLIATSVIGLFYYLRIIVTLYSKPEEGTPGTTDIGQSGEPAGVLTQGTAAPKPDVPRPVPIPAVAALAALVILLLWFGIAPAGLVRLVHLAAAALTGAP